MQIFKEARTSATVRQVPLWPASPPLRPAGLTAAICTVPPAVSEVPPLGWVAAARVCMTWLASPVAAAASAASIGRLGDVSGAIPAVATQAPAARLWTVAIALQVARPNVSCGNPVIWLLYHWIPARRVDCHVTCTTVLQGQRQRGW